MSAQNQTSTEPERITPREVIDRLNRGEEVFFVDTRNPNAWGAADTKLPQAVHVAADRVTDHLAGMPRDRMIVTYCT